MGAGLFSMAESLFLSSSTSSYTIFINKKVGVREQHYTRKLKTNMKIVYDF